MTREHLRKNCEAFVKKMCPHVGAVEQTRIVLRLMGQFECLGHVKPVKKRTAK